MTLKWVSPQTGVRRSTGTVMVGYWLKAEASSGQDKGQDKAETRQRAANTTAQSRHAVMARGWMDDGGRSFAEGVRDDWRLETGDWRGSARG